MAQAVLYKLFEKLPTFRYDPKKRFRGLLHRLIYRAIVDLYRPAEAAGRPRQRRYASPRPVARSHGPGSPRGRGPAQELTQQVAGQREQDSDSRWLASASAGG